MADLYKRLKETFERASKNIQEASDARRKSNGRKATETSIPLGHKVYVKDHTVRGRRKLGSLVSR